MYNIARGIHFCAILHVRSLILIVLSGMRALVFSADFTILFASSIVRQFIGQPFMATPM
jgi:hypothetical protein